MNCSNVVVMLPNGRSLTTSSAEPRRKKSQPAENYLDFDKLLRTNWMTVLRDLGVNRRIVPDWIALLAYKKQ